MEKEQGSRDYQDDVGLSPQRDSCPALHQSQKPLDFPRQFLAAETSELPWAVLCVPLMREQTQEHLSTPQIILGRISLELHSRGRAKPALPVHSIRGCGEGVPLAHPVSQREVWRGQGITGLLRRLHTKSLSLSLLGKSAATPGACTRARGSTGGD